MSMIPTRDQPPRLAQPGRRPALAPGGTPPGIGPRELLRIIRKRKWLILLCFLVCAGGMFAVTLAWAIYAPFYTADASEQKNRIGFYPPGYYQAPSWYYVTPYAYIDGAKGDYVSSGWQNKIVSRSHVASPLEITLTGSYALDSKTGTLNVAIKNTSASSITGSLRVVMTETNLTKTGAPNGESKFNQACRDLIPDETGTPVTIPAGQIVNGSRDFTVKSSWVPENCQLIAFVQDENMTADSTLEVFQAAKVKVTSIPPTGIAGPVNPRPKTITLSAPRPSISNGAFTIAYGLPKDGPVTLTVYNLLGSKVTTLVNENQAAGTHVARWDGRDPAGSKVPAGVYLFRLSAAGSTKISRGTVTR